MDANLLEPLARIAKHPAAVCIVALADPRRATGEVAGVDEVQVLGIKVHTQDREHQHGHGRDAIVAGQ